MRPGFTRATQNSGEPLPEPMRTSAGLELTGTSGNTRIHKRPERLMWRVIARRAASIWRAVIRSGSMALRPKAPKLSSVPPLALPWMRPLKALRNLVRLGCSISYFPSRLPVAALFAGRTDAGGLSLHHQPVLRQRVVAKNLALEDPDLHTAHAVRGVRFGLGVIDVATERVQRNAALTVPFGPRDFRAAETPRARATNALPAKTERGLPRTLHCAAERDTALELVGNTLSYELGVDLRLANLDDVQADVGARHLLKLALQLFDVRALLADDHARTRRIDGDAADLGRTLDHYFRDRGLRQLLDDVAANLQVLEQQTTVVLTFREPAAVPGTVDLQAKADRRGFLTHDLSFFLLANDDPKAAERLDDPTRTATRAGREALHRD